MSISTNSDTIFGTTLTKSPETSRTNSLDAAKSTFHSRSPGSSSSSSSATLDDETLTTHGRSAHFRSASLALDAAATSFSQYKGVRKHGRGLYKCFFLTCAAVSDMSYPTEDSVLKIDTEMGYIATMMSPLTAAIGSGTMSFLQSGSNTIVDGLPELLKVLQDVAAVHPFIARMSSPYLFRIEHH